MGEEKAPIINLDELEEELYAHLTDMGFVPSDEEVEVLCEFFASYYSDLVSEKDDEEEKEDEDIGDDGEPIE